MSDELEIKVPDALEAGVYANLANVWHTRSEFAIDFLARPVDSQSPDVARLVARVKIPTIFVFELIRRLNASMTYYEREHGAIPPLGE